MGSKGLRSVTWLLQEHLVVSYLVYFSPLMASESRFLCTLITKLQDYSPWMFLNSNHKDYFLSSYWFQGQPWPWEDNSLVYLNCILQQPPSWNRVGTDSSSLNPKQARTKWTTDTSKAITRADFMMVPESIIYRDDETTVLGLQDIMKACSVIVKYGYDALSQTIHNSSLCFDIQDVAITMFIILIT